MARQHDSENLPSVREYDINLKILPEDVHEFFTQYGGSIKVACRMLVANHTDRRISNISLLLYRLLEVEEVVDQKGQSMNFAQSIRALKGLPRLQVNNVNVRLVGCIPPRGTGEMTVCYEGPICGYQEVWPYAKDHVSRSYTLLRLDVLWYPLVAFPSRESLGMAARSGHYNYVMRISVETGLVAATAGALIEEKIEVGRIAYTWRSEEPTWRLDLACAPFLRMESDNSTLYFLEEHLKGAKIVNRALTRTIRLCNRWFDTAAKKRLNIVEIRKGYGSQTSPGLILLTSDSFEVDRNDEDKTYRKALSAVGHEAIHLWNVPSTEKYVSRWTDEGFAHYFQARLLREEFGEKAYVDQLEHYRQFFLRGGDLAIDTPIAEAGKAMKVREAISRGKGPWVLAVLHEIVGETTFLHIIREFIKVHSSGASLEDFASTAQQIAGRNLEPFFEDWFYSANSSNLLLKRTTPSELASKYEK